MWISNCPSNIVENTVFFQNKLSWNCCQKKKLTINVFQYSHLYLIYLYLLLCKYHTALITGAFLLWVLKLKSGNLSMYFFKKLSYLIWVFCFNIYNFRSACQFLPKKQNKTKATKTKTKQTKNKQTKEAAHLIGHSLNVYIDFRGIDIFTY